MLFHIVTWLNEAATSSSATCLADALETENVARTCCGSVISIIPWLQNTVLWHYPVYFLNFVADCECNETNSNAPHPSPPKPKASEYYSCALLPGYTVFCPTSLPKIRMLSYPIWTWHHHLQIAVFAFTDSECNCANSRSCTTQIKSLERKGEGSGHMRCSRES